MLFRSHFIGGATTETTPVVPLVVLFILAVVVNIIWLIVNWKLVYFSLSHAKRELTDTKGPYYLDEYAKNVVDRSHIPSSNKLLGVCLPSSFLLAWIVLGFAIFC